MPDFYCILCLAIMSSWNPEALLFVEHHYLSLHTHDRTLILPIPQSHHRKFNEISSALAFETCFYTAMKSWLFNGQLPLPPSSKFALSQESLTLKTENRNFGKYIIRNAKEKMLSVWKNALQTKFNTHLFVQLFLVEGRKSWQTEKIYNIVCIVEENLDFGLSPSIVTWLLQCAVNLWSEPLLVSPSQPQHKLKPVAWSLPVEMGLHQSCLRGVMHTQCLSPQKTLV